MVQCGAGSTSRMIDNDCGCHLMVEDASVEHSQNGISVKCVFNVLASTDPAQNGKTQTEYYQVDGKAVDKLYNLAEACGLITVAQRKAAAEQGVGLEIDETQLKGRQLCAQVKMEPNMRKNPATGANEIDPLKPGPYPRIGFRTFSVTDAKAKDIPKDQQFLGIIAQAQAQGRQQVQQSVNQQPQQQQQSLPGVNTTPPATSMNW
jgi:hypothetical protein